MASHLAQDGKLAKAGGIHKHVLSGLGPNHGNPLQFSLEEFKRKDSGEQSKTV